MIYDLVIASLHSDNHMRYYCRYVTNVQCLILPDAPISYRWLVFPVA